MKSLSTSLSVKAFVNRLALLAFFVSAFSAETKAQSYCTPVPYYSYCCSYSMCSSYGSYWCNSFQLNGYGSTAINWTRSCSSSTSSGYVNATGTDSCKLQQGATYSGNLYVSTGYYHTDAIWIDFNDDGTFSPSEVVYFSNVSTCCTGAPSGISLTIPLSAPTGRHRMRIRSGYTSSTSLTPSTFDPCQPYWIIGSTYYYLYYGGAIDYEVNIVAAPPCSGMPSVTTNPTGSVSICAGANVLLTGSAGIYSGYGWQWMTATSSSGPWTAISGATDPYGGYTTPPVIATQYYQLWDTCLSSGNVGKSGTIAISPGSPSYVAPPYVQSFDNTWQTFCSLRDVPDGHWSNTPSTGNFSWRRNDDGSAAGWTYPVITSSLTYWNGGNAYQSGGYSARMHSGGYYYSYPSGGGRQTGDLDLYMDGSTTTGNKLLSFYWQSQMTSSNLAYVDEYQQDSLYVVLSTDGGLTWNTLWGTRYNLTSTWPNVRLELPTNTAHNIIRFRGVRWEGLPGTSYYYYGYDYTDIGIDSVYLAPPCNGTPPTPYVSASGTSGCAGSSFTLVTGGVPMAGGYKYTWQQSIDGGTTWANTGDTTYNLTTPQLWTTTQYRVAVQCKYAGSAVTSGAQTFTISNSPAYAPSLPYWESFERVPVNRCASSDEASPYTAVWPTSGYMSWRREDKGSTSGWYSSSTSSPYCYSPLSYDSSHSSHCMLYYDYGQPSESDNFHFVNCSSPAGTKELDFAYIMPTTSYSPTDTLVVSYSVDSGRTYTRLLTHINTSGGWNFQRFPLPSNSPKTIIKFAAMHPLYYSYNYGIGIDAVSILPPCTGKPTPGTIPNVVACANKKFQISDKGYSRVAGLGFQWIESFDGGATWSITDPGDTLPNASIAFPKNGFLKCVVTCRNTGQSDSTNAASVSMTPFYYCYCNPDSVNCSGSYNYVEWGFTNVAITKVSTGDSILDNGIPTPINYNPHVQSMYYNIGSCVSRSGWSIYDTLHRLSHLMYLDSSYNFYATIGNAYGYNYSYPTNFYIDFDHSGSFETSEKVFDKNNGTATTTAIGAATVAQVVTIPHNAMTGLTGMRVLYGYALSSPLDPCGPPQYHYGEVQDYLVDLEWRPCNTKLTAGTAVSTDTVMCPGYTFTITDTTHEYHQSGMTYYWQQSFDHTTWSSVPGGLNRDTMTLTFQGTNWYRMVVVCNFSHDTTYSNTVRVLLGPPYQCYCYSMAVGGTRFDSSDIGAFTFGPYVVNKKGPHVSNPAATAGHTNEFGATPWIFGIDSTYAVGVYHILRSATHGDAKVTLFLDYNNNFRYDIPEERVWTAYTSSTDWFLTTSISIPHSVIGGVPTGMRLIINNNTAPNVPSDSACGVYTSGETMDFVVRFDNIWPANIGTISSIENLDMYPNPTTGKFNIKFNATKTIGKLQVNISNMTGQQVLHREFTNTSGQFNTELDMTNQPRGLYFVEFIGDGERIIRKLVIE
jgi:hypothetical protein